MRLNNPGADKVYSDDELRWSRLMASAQQGDETRYRQLLQELSSVIHRYLISRLGQHEIVEDCVQESLLAIHHARHTYRPSLPFRPWLFAIVRNKSIDMLRKRSSYEKMLLSRADHIELTGGGLSANSMNRIDSEIIQGRLIEALAPAHRQAIILTKLIGFSNAEAARVLSISETAVKVRVHRGMAKLKHLMETDE